MGRRLDIFTDGACSGNPGIAALAYVIRDGENRLGEHACVLGQATNNVAEYAAVVSALEEARRLGADEVILHTDSELIYHQLKGTYQVKHPNMKALFDQVVALAREFSKITFRHVPREENREADGLAKQAIKREQTKTVASPQFVFDGGEESPSSAG